MINMRYNTKYTINKQAGQQRQRQRQGLRGRGAEEVEAAPTDTGT